MIWQKIEIDSSLTKELVKRYEIDKISATILNRRGILIPEEIKYFLEDDLRFLHNPFLFPDMLKVIERIKKAAINNEKVLIYGDRDADGITSTILAIEMLKEDGLEPLWKLPLGDDDYGLSLSDIEEAFHQDIKLLITVDCGISNLKEIKKANELGMEVIVLDHHLPQAELPEAFAIINPKIEKTGYPFRDLAGCGVVSKVDWSLAFSRSSIFNKSFILAHIIPLHDSFLLEAFRVKNLVKVEFYRDTVIPSLAENIWKRFKNFIQNDPVYVFNEHEINKIFKKVFLKHETELKLIDFQNILNNTFSNLKAKSLLKIREISKLQRYNNEIFSEIETFFNLFVSCMLQKEKDCFAGFVNRLDLAALGTIADLMPILNENRIIVKKGLELINQFQRKAIREICLRKNLLNKPLTLKEISWQIAPLINAAGRLGEPHKAVELFLANDEEKIQELIDHLFKLNEKRKEMVDKIWNRVLNEADDSFKKTDGKFVFVSTTTIHRGITGLIANQMVKYFKVPACIVAELEHKAVGSMRSIEEVSLKSFLEHFKDLFTDYGGHDLAAGFNLPKEQVEKFRQRFYEVVKQIEQYKFKEENLVIDAEIPVSYLTPDLIKVVERFAPYGEGNPNLLFYTSGLKVIACEAIGKKEQLHLKLLLDTGKYKFPAILWNGIDQYGKNYKVGDIVDVVYKFNKNFYQNNIILQLIICDIALKEVKKLANVFNEKPFFDSELLSDF